MWTSRASVWCTRVLLMALFSRHFYPRDAMLARVIEIATCLSVRPSVTRRYCVKTKNASSMISSPSGSPKTLVFWRQISSPNSKGFSPNGASNKGRSEKFSDFLTLSVNISKTVADMRPKLLLVTIGSRAWAFDWHQDRWPWMTLNCCKVKFCQNFAWFRDFGRQLQLNEWR